MISIETSPLVPVYIIIVWALTAPTLLLLPSQCMLLIVLIQRTSNRQRLLIRLAIVLRLCILSSLACFSGPSTKPAWSTDYTYAVVRLELIIN